MWKNSKNALRKNKKTLNFKKLKDKKLINFKPLVNRTEA